MTSRSHPSQPVGQPGGGDRGDRRGISEHEPDPGRRQRRVDRQIRRPGLEHRQNRHDRLGRPGQQQRHTLPRARTLAGQQVRQPVSGLIELAVGHRAALEAQRHRLGCARHLRGEQHRNRHRRGRGLGQHRPVTRPHPAGRAHRHPAHPSTTTAAVGSAVIAANTRCNRSISVSMLAGVEHVGVEFDAKAQFGARHGLHCQRVVVGFAAGELGDGQLVVA